MPNPDALLLKKFFVDGWFIREWFIDSRELHTVPQISVTDYKSYFKMYMKEKLKDLYYYNSGPVAGRPRMFEFIHENIDRWQLVYNELCDREGKYDEINALNEILKNDILYMPGWWLTLGPPPHPWYPVPDPDPWYTQPQPNPTPTRTHSRIHRCCRRIVRALGRLHPQAR